MASDTAREQEYVDAVYARLDELRARTEQQLAQVRRAGGGGTFAARTERDAFATLHEDRLAQLRAVEDRLAFGRLDLTGSRTRYIGRIGLSDADQTPLLTDWRAPAAEAFYQATAASPGDVVRRRHLTLRGREVVAIEDDVLDAEAALADESLAGDLHGEGALIAALNAHRTGRMRDIVATIQAEQDRVIRAPLPGVLVVQGGPGTGKTAVALHRAAYLLYAHRDRVARAGVLVVGPGRAFLRYIEQVLPALGETGVVMAAAGELYPGVDADPAASAAEDPRTTALKGDLRMSRVVAAAVRDRQRVPAAPVPLHVEGRTVFLRPETVAAARGRARATHKPHNEARATFVKHVLGDLTRQLATELGLSVDDDSRSELQADLRASVDVRREINLCWLPVTPQRLLRDLYADPARLERVAPDLSATERALLRREPGARWTVSDVPLLDEAADLLGEDDTAARAEAARAARERAAEVAYARDVVQMNAQGILVSADTMVDRWSGADSLLSVAERAASDRTWAFGHVVVDEAQELSPMMWRLLMRRCPSRSMTVVGDVAQTGSSAGATSWGSVLDEHVRDRWRVEELTVNYRTPRQVMDLAGALLEAHGVQVTVPRSAREGEHPPRAVVLPGDATKADDVLLAEVRDELAALGEGRLAVVVPDARRHAAYRLLSEALGDDVVRSARDDRDTLVTVTTVGDVKGLEFDTVLVLEPAEVVEQSLRGVNDLYVALTRPTQRLVLLHSGDLPAGLTLP